MNEKLLPKNRQYSRLIEGDERIRESIQVYHPITGKPDAKTSTIHDVLWRSATLYPNQPLFGQLSNFGDYQWTTYKDALDAAQLIGSSLIYLGAESKSLIGIAGIHSRNYMHAIHGITSFNMTVVPLYHQSKLETLCDIIENCNLEIILCDTLSRAEKFIEEFTNNRIKSIKTLVVLDESAEIFHVNGVRLLSFTDFLQIGTDNKKEFRKPLPESIYVICHTSGTTGKPKGVEMSHKGLLAAVSGIYTSWTIAHDWKFGNDDVYFSFLSLAHIYEHLMQTLTLYFGGRIGIYDGNTATLIPQIQTLKPTIVSLVPRLLNKLYESVHNEIAKKNFILRKLFELAKGYKEKQLENGLLVHDGLVDRIIFRKTKNLIGGNVKVLTTGGAPVTKEVKTFSRYAYGCPLIEGYGQTECSAAGTLTLPWDTSYGNVGGPSPWAQVKLIDVPEKNYYSYNDEGEVCFRGPALMTSYYNDKELTSKTIDSEGWLHTGDIGRWLQNGSLQIIDRKNEMFKLCQGDFVSPIQIESIYSNSPLITQIFVTGSTERSFLVGVAVMDRNRLKLLRETNTALKQYASIGDEKLIQIGDVRKIILDELNMYGKQHGLQTIELIRNVYLTLQEFTEENGLVTSTLKNRRKIIEAFFSDKIAMLYAEMTSL